MIADKIKCWNVCRGGWQLCRLRHPGFTLDMDKVLYVQASDTDTSVRYEFRTILDSQSGPMAGCFS